MIWLHPRPLIAGRREQACYTERRKIERERCMVALSAVMERVEGWTQRTREQLKFGPLTILDSRYTSIIPNAI